MRSFWLSVTVIAGVLLLVSLRVEGSKRSAKTRAAAAAATEPKTTEIVGYGETKEGARREALRLTQEWVEGEVRGQLKEGWSFPQDKLDPRTMEDLAVIDRQPKEPTRDDDVGGWRAEYAVTLTPQYVQAVAESARKDYVDQEKAERKDTAGRRLGLVFRVLGGAVVVLLVVAGYLRLEEATHGYYTGLLRAAAIGVVVLAALAMLLIG